MTTSLDFITVTLNPAIDHTVFVEGLTPGEVHRASRSHRQAGGKGVNVATMLSLGGARAAVTGFLGEENTSIFERHFGRHGLRDAFVRVDGETRTCIKIVDTKSEETTDLNLRGPAPTPAQQALLLERVARLAAPGRWCVIAGSLPAGIGPEFVAEIVRAVHDGGGLIAIDSSGPALKAGIAAGADLAKPNALELSEYLGVKLKDFRQTVNAARELRRAKTPNLVVSLGGEGALFLSPEAELMAAAPKARVVSTVGAGDSLLAGYLLAHAAGESPAACAQLGTVYAWNRLESLMPSLPSADVIRSQMAQISVQPLTAFERAGSSHPAPTLSRN
ncbi:MAG: 1-phosphofructokinase [Verrucomicrobiota bacterium JB024]|nr:1-phosphofructokinase [Verrucomicrobiota bacterium JB024]